jgi:hypothetical protein
VGIDTGIKDLAILSDGTTYDLFATNSGQNVTIFSDLL